MALIAPSFFHQLSVRLISSSTSLSAANLHQTILPELSSLSLTNDSTTNVVSRNQHRINYPPGTLGNDAASQTQVRGYGGDISFDRLLTGEDGIPILPFNCESNRDMSKRYFPPPYFWETTPAESPPIAQLYAENPEMLESNLKLFGGWSFFQNDLNYFKSKSFTNPIDLVSPSKIDEIYQQLPSSFSETLSFPSTFLGMTHKMYDFSSLVAVLGKISSEPLTEKTFFQSQFLVYFLAQTQVHPSFICELYQQFRIPLSIPTLSTIGMSLLPWSKELKSHYSVENLSPIISPQNRTNFVDLINNLNITADFHNHYLFDVDTVLTEAQQQISQNQPNLFKNLPSLQFLWSIEFVFHVAVESVTRRAESLCKIDSNYYFAKDPVEGQFHIDSILENHLKPGVINPFLVSNSTHASMDIPPPQPLSLWSYDQYSVTQLFSNVIFASVLNADPTLSKYYLWGIPCAYLAYENPTSSLINTLSSCVMYQLFQSHRTSETFDIFHSLRPMAWKQWSAPSSREEDSSFSNSSSSSAPANSGPSHSAYAVMIHGLFANNYPSAALNLWAEVGGTDPESVVTIDYGRGDSTLAMLEFPDHEIESNFIDDDDSNSASLNLFNMDSKEFHSDITFSTQIFNSVVHGLLQVGRAREAYGLLQYHCNKTHQVELNEFTFSGCLEQILVKISDSLQSKLNPPEDDIDTLRRPDTPNDPKSKSAPIEYVDLMWKTYFQNISSLADRSGFGESFSVVSQRFLYNCLSNKPVQQVEMLFDQLMKLAIIQMNNSHTQASQLSEKKITTLKQVFAFFLALNDKSDITGTADASTLNGTPSKLEKFLQMNNSIVSATSTPSSITSSTNQPIPLADWFLLLHKFETQPSQVRLAELKSLSLDSHPLDSHLSVTLPLYFFNRYLFHRLADPQVKVQMTESDTLSMVGELFDHMKSHNIQPNETTFVLCLSRIGQMFNNKESRGLFKKLRKLYFKMVQNKSIPHVSTIMANILLEFDSYHHDLDTVMSTWADLMEDYVVLDGVSYFQLIASLTLEIPQNSIQTIPFSLDTGETSIVDDFSTGSGPTGSSLNQISSTQLPIKNPQTSPKSDSIAQIEHEISQGIFSTWLSLGDDDDDQENSLHLNPIKLLSNFGRFQLDPTILQLVMYGILRCNDLKTAEKLYTHALTKKHIYHSHPNNSNQMVVDMSATPLPSSSKFSTRPYHSIQFANSCKYLPRPPQKAKSVALDLAVPFPQKLYLMMLNSFQSIPYSCSSLLDDALLSQVIPVPSRGLECWMTLSSQIHSGPLYMIPNTFFCAWIGELGLYERKFHSYDPFESCRTISKPQEKSAEEMITCVAYSYYLSKDYEMALKYVFFLLYGYGILPQKTLSALGADLCFKIGQDYDLGQKLLDHAEKLVLQEKELETVETVGSLGFVETHHLKEEFSVQNNSSTDYIPENTFQATLGDIQLVYFRPFFSHPRVENLLGLHAYGRNYQKLSKMIQEFGVENDGCPTAYASHDFINNVLKPLKTNYESLSL